MLRERRVVQVLVLLRAALGDPHSLLVRVRRLLFLPSVHEGLEHCSKVFSAAGRAIRIRLCSTEDGMLNGG